jgi:acyl-CoA synthetase (AMP-forming)/AMP-acid ligase II
MNIVEPILYQARRQPEAPALCAQGVDVVSYARLVAQMSAIARRASSFGLRAGNVVAVSVEEPLLHAVVILGLTQIGIATLSVAGHRPPAGLKIDAVISSKPYPFAIEAQRFIIDHHWMTLGHSPAGTASTVAGAGDRTCRIVLTSGTTGDPKAVALSHTTVMARNARFEYVTGNRLPVISRLYVNMGLGAALGFQFLTWMLGRGGTIFFPGINVESTLRSFDVFRIEGMLATPATLTQLLKVCDNNPSIEIHLDTIICSGSLLPRSLAERVRPRLCSHLITGYGSTETAMSAMAPAHQLADVQGAAGYVTPGTNVEIVDEMDHPVPEGTEGIIRVASEFGVNSYIDDPVESAQVFRNGWFYPGDIGSLTPDNLLVISGRQNDVLNIGGGKIAAEKIEAVLLSFKGVNEAAAFMVTDPQGSVEIWAAIVGGEPIDHESLRAHCRPSMPLAFVPKHILPLETLPVNAAGKVDRLRLKQMIVNGGASS